MYKIQPKSYAKFEEVIKILALSPNKYRHPTTFQVNGEWYSERVFTYYAQKLCALGIAEQRYHSRGWYSWITYRLKFSSIDAWNKLTGAPF